MSENTSTERIDNSGVTELTDEERQPCEVWTRVMGYHRPVASFNRGKRAEYAERVCFAEPAATDV
jgi:anaerobic ribonucleoside-triphosphate reductase